MTEFCLMTYPMVIMILFIQLDKYGLGDKGGEFIMAMCAIFTANFLIACLFYFSGYYNG